MRNDHKSCTCITQSLISMLKIQYLRYTSCPSPSKSIPRKAIQILLRLTSNITRWCCAVVPFVTIRSDAARCGRGVPQSTVVFTRERTFASSRADVNGSLVGGLPVASGGWLFGQGQVVPVVFNLLALVGVFVDHGLKS